MDHVPRNTKFPARKNRNINVPCGGGLFGNRGHNAGVVCGGEWGSRSLSLSVVDDGTNGKLGSKSL